MVRIFKVLVFPVVLYRCETWTIKKAEHQRIGAFKLWSWRRLESLLDYNEIKSVNPKGDPPWLFIRRTDGKAEVSILWPSDVESQLIGKDLDVGKDWRQEERGATEDEMVGWHHRLNGHSKLQEIVKDGEAWRAAVHGVAKRWTWLSNNNKKRQRIGHELVN